MNDLDNVVPSAGPMAITLEAPLLGYGGNEETIVQILEEEKNDEFGLPDLDLTHHNSIIFEVNQAESKVLLKNLDSKCLSPGQKKEDYTMMIFWFSFYCGKQQLFKRLLELAPTLGKYCRTGVSQKDLLQNKELNSVVIIGAIRQKEDAFLGELLKMENLSYNISLEMVVMLIENGYSNYLRNLFQQDRIAPRSIFSFRTSKPESYFTELERKKHDPHFKEDMQKWVASKTLPHLKRGNSKSSFAATAMIMSKQGVSVQFTFKDVLPELKKLERTDLVDLMIELLGEGEDNHMDLFLNAENEDLVIKYYKKDLFDLTPKQVLTALQNRYFDFLCQINDPKEQCYLFLNDAFALMMEILRNGTYLTELALLLQEQSYKYWKEPQGQLFLEACKELLNQYPLSNRIQFCSNPILACALLSYILRRLSQKRFEYFVNDFVSVSDKMESLARIIQNSTPEKNLSILYLVQLPTGKNMLYYIMRCKTKTIVESTFVRSLIHEFWNQSYTKTGSRRHYSKLSNMMKSTKRFEWNAPFEPQLERNYPFQLQSTVLSAKVFLIWDIVFLLMFYYFIDEHIYMKQQFFDDAEDPTYIPSLPNYTMDPIYALYPARFMVQFVLMINFWIGLLYRVIGFHVHDCKIKLLTLSHHMLFLTLTVVLIMSPIFNTYQSQKDHEMLITAMLVLLRFTLGLTVCTLLLMFKGLGTILTIVWKIATRFIMLILMISLVTIFLAEYFQNFFRSYAPFNTVAESYFTLIELLFGSITFPNPEDIPGDMAFYYVVNISMTLWTFLSNVAFIFLLIAYMTTIYTATTQQADYKRTKFQYHIISYHSNLEFKGFYGFALPLSVLILPFIVFSFSKEALIKLSKKLLHFQYYVMFYPMHLLYEFFYGLLISLPVAYCKYIFLLLQGKYARSLTTPGAVRWFTLLLWMIVGPFYLFGIVIQDTARVGQIMMKNQDFEKAQIYMLREIVLHVDDDIYVKRYKVIKNALLNYVSENEKSETVSMDELLNYIIENRAEAHEGAPPALAPAPPQGSATKKVGRAKLKLSEIIRKHHVGKLKSKSNVMDAKDIKNYVKALDNMLNIKNAQYNSYKEADLDVNLVLELLNNVDMHNVIYLRLKRVPSIQSAILQAQEADLVTVLKRLDDIEEKISLMLTHVVKTDKKND
jgi:hypothetical protein